MDGRSAPKSQFVTPAMALMELREQAIEEENRIVELFFQLTEKEQRELMLRAMLSNLRWIECIKTQLPGARS